MLNTITHRFNGQRFLRGVGSVLSIGPAHPTELVPPPKEMTDGEALSSDWEMVGGDLRCAIDAVAGLVQSDDAAR
jgi:hypothetical protein